MGSGSVSGGESGGMSGQQGSSQEPGDGGTGGTGGEGSGAGDQATANEKSDRDGGQVVELPDDIPIDGSGDDVVGRQIREAAISMQESNPEAAEKLWDEYRKHTGIK